MKLISDVQYSNNNPAPHRRLVTLLYHLFELWSSQTLQTWRILWAEREQEHSHGGLQHRGVQPHVQGRGEVRHSWWWRGQYFVLIAVAACLPVSTVS